MSDERLHILELIESGEISVGEGVQRLEGQGGTETAAPSDRSGAPRSTSGRECPSPPLPVPGIVRIAWQIVFGVGVAVLAGAGLLLAGAYSREGMPGLTWGWVLFVLGLLVLLLGWYLERARWFHLRVRESGGRAFTVAFPLPLGLALGLLRVSRPFVPQLRDLEVDQLILAMRDELEDGRFLVVQVDEGEGGDQVEIRFT